MSADSYRREEMPGGYADDTDGLILYRVTMANTIALPCGSKRKLYGSVNDKYALGVMSGARPDNLNHNQYWYTGTFEVDIPDGDNFYRISIANAFRVIDNVNYVDSNVFDLFVSAGTIVKVYRIPKTTS